MPGYTDESGDFSQEKAIEMLEKEGIAFEQVTAPPHFGNITADLYQAVENGRMTHDMFNIMVWVKYHMHYRTASCERFCASRVLRALWPEANHMPRRKYRAALRRIQVAIELLAKCGYISKPDDYVSDMDYEIVVHNHLVGGLRLRPRDTIPYRDALKGDLAGTSRAPRGHLAGVSRMPRGPLAGSSQEPHPISSTALASDSTDSTESKESTSQENIVAEASANATTLCSVPKVSQQSKAGSIKPETINPDCGPVLPDPDLLPDEPERERPASHSNRPRVGQIGRAHV